MTRPHRTSSSPSERSPRPSHDWADLASQLSGFYGVIGTLVLYGFYCLLALGFAAVMTWGMVKFIGIIPGLTRGLMRLLVLLWSLPWIYKIVAPFALFYVFSLLWIEFMRDRPRSADPPIRGRHVLSGQDARRRAAALVDGPSSRSARSRS